MFGIESLGEFHNPVALPATEMSRSRLTELEAELSKSHYNFGRLASQLDQVDRDFERLTRYDLLTGLANPTLYFDQLSGFIAIARRERRKLSLLALVAMSEAKRSGGEFVACAPDQNR